MLAVEEFPLVLPTTATKESYIQYEDLLFDRARAIAIDYCVDMDEMVSYARTLFIEAVETYDPNRGASLCTHLYNRLKKLHHLGRKMVNHKKAASLTAQVGDTGLTHEDVIGKEDEVLVNKELFEYLERHALPDEYALSVAILDGTLDPSEGNKAKMSAWAVYQRGMRQIGWDWKRTQIAWNGLTSVMMAYRQGIDLVRG